MNTGNQKSSLSIMQLIFWILSKKVLNQRSRWEQDLNLSKLSSQKKNLHPKSTDLWWVFLLTTKMLMVVKYFVCMVYILLVDFVPVQVVVILEQVFKFVFYLVVSCFCASYIFSFITSRLCILVIDASYRFSCPLLCK